MNYDLELLDTYKTILSEFKDQKELKEICIAGGAIRDMLLDKPIKDIDIFYSGELDKEFIEKTFKKKEKPQQKNPPWKKVTLHNHDGVLLMEEPIVIYDESKFQVPYQELYYKDVTLPIQLIKVKDEEESIFHFVRKDFGCNLSKVLFGAGGLILTHEFILDATLNILTFKPDCQQNYRSRIIAKYPEYSCNGLGDDNSLEW